MKYIFFIFLFIHVPGQSQAIDYTQYAEILKKYVSASGRVDYTALTKQRSNLNQIVEYLGARSESKLNSKETKLAFWINVYNANTIKLIVDHYPIKSITELDNGKPWDVKRVSVDGKLYSLNQIENDIIRSQFKDPRIHFALNCGAISCPALLNKPYQPEDLYQQLDRQASLFLNSSLNKINSKNSRISKIFEWYKDDFGDLLKFINSYTGVKLSSSTKIDFFEYDWSLNGN